MNELPPTRWEQAGERRLGYVARFSELIDAGQDIDGEARLADTLLARNARVLDAGAGMGRVAAALQARGHDVLATEPDADLLNEAKARFPELATLQLDNLQLDADEIGRFDLIVCVGNVMILMAEGTEAAGLRTMASVLAPQGRILIGFSTTAGPAHSRAYSYAEFSADVADAGLQVQHHFSSYELAPAGESDDYVVAILTRVLTQSLP